MAGLSTATRHTASARSLPDKDFKADWGFKMCCSSSCEEAQRNRRKWLKVVFMEDLQPKSHTSDTETNLLNYAQKHRNWGAEIWQQVLWTDVSKYEIFGCRRRKFVQQRVESDTITSVSRQQ